MKTPGNYPEIIYKYRNWMDEHHKNLIYKNQLYLSSPEHFNDPFDCKIPTNYLHLDSPEKIQKHIDSFLDKNRDFIIKKGYNISVYRKKLIKEYSDIDKVQHKNEQIVFDLRNKHFGVISMSACWKNILMWSHYANYHKGYCVGFYEEKTKKLWTIW